MKNTILKIISISLMIVNSGYLLASDHPTIKTLKTAFKAKLRKESRAHRSKLNILLARCENKKINKDQRRNAIGKIDTAALAHKRREAQRAKAETKTSTERAGLLDKKRDTITQELRLNRQLALHTRGMAPIIPGINSDDSITPAPAMPAETAPAGDDSKVALEHLSEPNITVEFADVQAKYLQAMRAGLSPDMSIPEELIPPSIQDQRLLDKSARQAALQKFKLKSAARAVAVGIIPAAFADAGIMPSEPISFLVKDLAQQIGVSQRTAQWIKELGLTKQALENARNKGTPFENCTPQTQVICTAKRCESRSFDTMKALSGHQRRVHSNEPFCTKCLKGFGSKAAFIADHFPKKSA